MSELPRVAEPLARQLVPPLADQVVFVTGAASGLGRCIADSLSEAGARVAMADIAEPRLHAEASALSEHGRSTLALPLDVGDATAVEAALATVHTRWGRLDAVINCAAIDITAPIAELEAEQWERIVRTNLNGPYFVSRAAAALMRHGGGHIVNVASTAAKRTWPNAAAYHATKWGLLGLSHALHSELRVQGIKVCALIAGGMRTPFLLDRFPDIDVARLQDPMDVARTVRFVLTQPPGTVIPEMMVLPAHEASWP